ncbi:MAG TPA: hypothetical protein PLD03_02645 [Thiomonas arsenitoxydans]|nr:hypothetical protein [Thiomonas arsenitoxydans]
MSHPIPNNQLSQHKVGIFHPRGYVLLVFNAHENAENTLKALLEGGYDDSEIVRYHANDILGLVAELKGHSGLFSKIGYEINLLDRYETLARENCCFLEVFAPSDAETNRVMRVARRFGVRQAEKYGAFMIEDLVAS